MAMQSDRMIGPGGVRRFKARWIVQCRLEAETPIHLGNGEAGDFVDLALLRDALSGAPLLPGTSLAGGLRDFLCDHLLGDRKLERDLSGDIVRLFGGTREDPNGEQSPLIVFDSIGIADRSEIRDGVRIDPDSATAAEHLKFDMELWPAGTQFPIRLDLLVPEALSDVDEARLAALLASATEAFSSGNIRLGARVRRGFGRCRLTDPKARRFDLTKREGWVEWLTSGTDAAHATTGSVEASQSDATHVTTSSATVSQSVGTAVQGAWEPAQAELIRQHIDGLKKQCRLSTLTLDIPIRFSGGLLIRSPQASATGPDVRHLTSNEKPVLSGTSLAGTLRQRALRIAHFVRCDKGDHEEWVHRLFGRATKLAGMSDNQCALSQSGQGRQEKKSKDQLGHEASRVIVDEVPLDETKSTALQVARIKIDRFTQAPVDGALLEEEVIYGAHTTLRLTLRLPGIAGNAPSPYANALCGLFLLVIKDLLLGDIPIGGTSGIGRGAVRWDGPCVLVRDNERLEISESNAPSTDHRKLVDGWVAQFKEHAKLVPPDVLVRAQV